MVEKLEIFDNRLLQTSMEEINPFQNVSVDPVNYPRWQPLLKMPFFPLSIISNFWYLIQLIYIFWNNIDIFKTSSEPLNEMKQNLNTSILRWPLPTFVSNLKICKMIENWWGKIYNFQLLSIAWANQYQRRKKDEYHV